MSTDLTHFWKRGMDGVELAKKISLVNDLEIESNFLEFIEDVEVDNKHYNLMHTIRELQGHKPILIEGTEVFLQPSHSKHKNFGRTLHGLIGNKSFKVIECSKYLDENCQTLTWVQHKIRSFYVIKTLFTALNKFPHITNKEMIKFWNGRSEVKDYASLLESETIANEKPFFDPQNPALWNILSGINEKELKDSFFWSFFKEDTLPLFSFQSLSKNIKLLKMVFKQFINQHNIKQLKQIERESRTKISHYYRQTEKQGFAILARGLDSPMNSYPVKHLKSDAMLYPEFEFFDVIIPDGMKCHDHLNAVKNDVIMMEFIQATVASLTGKNYQSDLLKDYRDSYFIGADLKFDTILSQPKLSRRALIELQQFTNMHFTWVNDAEEYPKDHFETTADLYKLSLSFLGKVPNLSKIFKQDTYEFVRLASPIIRTAVFFNEKETKYALKDSLGIDLQSINVEKWRAILPDIVSSNEQQHYLLQEFIDEVNELFNQLIGSYEFMSEYKYEQLTKQLHNALKDLP